MRGKLYRLVERGREKGRDGGRDGGREGGREGGMEGWVEGGRFCSCLLVKFYTTFTILTRF